MSEDGGHLFSKCGLAKQVWWLLNLEKERAVLADSSDARGEVKMILKATSEKKLKMVMTLWMIWNERNIIREDGRWRSAEVLVRSIGTYTSEAYYNKDNSAA